MNKLKPYWHRIILRSIPIYMIGFLLLGGMFILLNNQQLRKNTQIEIDLFTQEKQSQLKAILQLALNDISIVADNQMIKKIGFEALGSKMELIPENNRSAIINILKNKPLYSGLLFLNASNEVLFNLNENSDLTVTYQAGIEKKLSIQNLPYNNQASIVFLADKKDSTQIKSVYAITPISTDNLDQILVAFEISGTKLLNNINSQNDKSYKIYFTTEKGGMDASKIDNNSKNTLVKLGQIGISGNQVKIRVEKDFGENYVKIKRLAFQVALIALIILTLTVIVNSYLVRRIINPLEQLKVSIEKLESGDNESATIYQNRDIVGWLGNSFNRLIMQIKHSANQLDERDERLKHFYLTTTDGIYIHNSGIPLIFNPALRNLTGYDEQELHKLRPSDFLIIDEEVIQAAHEQRFSLFEADLKTKEGKKLQVEVQLNNIVYRGQKAESMVIRDITHRKSIEQELQQERKRQVKSVIDGQEKERQRLSRELHDGLGQNLVAIKLKLESISAEKAGELEGTLNQVKQMFGHTIEEIRRISNNLMPAALKEFSLAVVLRNLCTEIESNSGIGIALNIGVLPESLDQILKTYVYRIVQEALTNVVKHSGANKASVSVFSDFSNLHLQIDDNGAGFNTTKLSDSGNGLYNMKERAMLLGGKINIISSKGKGVKIVAEFPLNQSISDSYV